MKKLITVISIMSVTLILSFLVLWTQQTHKGVEKSEITDLQEDLSSDIEYESSLFIDQVIEDQEEKFYQYVQSNFISPGKIYVPEKIEINANDLGSSYLHLDPNVKVAFENININTELDDLKKDIDEIVFENNYEDVRYSIYHLNSGKSVRSSRSEESHLSLSLIKIPIMIKVYEEIANGTLTLDQEVSYLGYKQTIETSLDRMIALSDNEATGALIRAVGGFEVVNQMIITILGEDSVTRLYNTPAYSDSIAFNAGFNSTSTDEMVQLLSYLIKGQIFDRDYSDLILAHLMTTVSVMDFEEVPGQLGYKYAADPWTIFGASGFYRSTNGEIFAFSLFTDNRNNFVPIDLEIYEQFILSLESFSKSLDNSL